MDLTYKEFCEEGEEFIKLAKINKGLFEITLKFPDTEIDVVATPYYTISISPLTKYRNTLGYLYLRGFYITPEHRGNGYGKEFMETLFSNCKKNNIKEIQIEPYYESVDFFIKLGFVFIKNLHSKDLRMSYKIN